MYVCMVCMHVCMYVCRCMYVCTVCMYVHTMYQCVVLKTKTKFLFDMHTHSDFHFCLTEGEMNH